MRADRGLLGWGVFLVVLGSVPLAVRAGLVDPALAVRAWELWPLILIGVGLGLALARTRAAVVGGLVAATTLGLMAGSALAVGVGGLPGCTVGAGSGAATPFPTRTGTLGSAADVRLDIGCGELAVTTTTGSAWTVSGSDRRGEGPDIASAVDLLRVRSGTRTGFGIDQGGGRWDVALPVDPILSLGVTIGAGSGRIDLAGAHLSSVSAAVNAGDARLDLSGALGLTSISGSANAGSLRISLPASSLVGRVSANAGSVDLCVPPGVGLRLRASGGALGSNNFGARGLAQDGETWTSPGFDAAAVRIDLSTSANVGAITLNPENGCD